MPVPQEHHEDGVWLDVAEFIQRGGVKVMKYVLLGGAFIGLLLGGVFAAVSLLPRNAKAPKATATQAAQQQDQISSNAAATEQAKKISQQPAQYQVRMERMFDNEGKPLGQIRLIILVNDQPTSQFFVPEEEFVAKAMATKNATAQAVQAGPTK